MNIKGEIFMGITVDVIGDKRSQWLTLSKMYQESRIS